MPFELEKTSIYFAGTVEIVEIGAEASKRCTD
jgi:hypothetical protein